MPPKGSKKKPKATSNVTAPGPDDDDGETIIEPPAGSNNGIDHYEIPKATLARLAKSAVPDKTNLAKEVPTALVRASTVFISYLAAISQDVATNNNHKTITGSHVLEAIKYLDWEDGDQVIRHMQSELKAFKAANQAKKIKPIFDAQPVASTSTGGVGVIKIPAQSAPRRAGTSSATPADTADESNAMQLRSGHEGQEEEEPYTEADAMMDDIQQDAEEEEVEEEPVHETGDTVEGDALPDPQRQQQQNADVDMQPS